MKITDNLHLEKSGQYFRVIEKGVSINEDTKKEKIVDKNPREFGTVYQALQYIISADYNVDENLLAQFKFLLCQIDKAKEDIKREFRTEVLTSRKEKI